MDNPASLIDPNVIANMSAFPGNAIPSILIPNLLDPTLGTIAGAQPTSWTAWVDKAKSVVLWPVHKVESAYQVVTNAPANIEAFVTRAEDAATSAATGIGTWTKWIVVGVVALAVIYLLTFLDPVKKAINSAAGAK